jgi:putative FmdB family regulatory protein
MPLYDYLCVDCGESEKRVASLDDYVALCAKCGGIMLRTDEDIWLPLWEEQLRQEEAGP